MHSLPCPERIIRKSAYGRTQLFLPSKGTILREVKCMGGIVKYEGANVYHVLPELYTKGNVACWHCCEQIQHVSECVPVPRFYDQTEKQYHVFGATCSPECAKAYVVEHSSFDRAQTLNVLTRMLREVYGVSGPVVATPPRPALLRFGGVFDPAQRRGVQCKLVEPPFVSYSMLAEEHVAGDEAFPTTQSAMQVEEEADTFDEPHPPALFAEYLTSRGSEEASTSVKRRRETKSRPPAPRKGPMARFVQVEE